MKDFDSRWTNALRRKITLAMENSDLSELGETLGHVEVDGANYIDCRGFRPVHMVKDAKLEKVDLSFARFQDCEGLSNGEYHSCLFRNVWYKSFLSSKFAKCDFSGAEFHRAQAGPRCRWTSCNFTNALFKCGAQELIGMRFSKCLFDHTRFRKTEFSECIFKECFFDHCDFGSMEETAFSGCKMISPRQNIKWFDTFTKENKSHVVDNEFPWLALNGVYVSGLEIQ
jgi:uncharacterized protein YjbI with pentapeptide repeats